MANEELDGHEGDFESTHKAFNKRVPGGQVGCVYETHFWSTKANPGGHEGFPIPIQEPSALLKTVPGAQFGSFVETQTSLINCKPLGHDGSVIPTQDLPSESNRSPEGQEGGFDEMQEFPCKFVPGGQIVLGTNSQSVPEKYVPTGQHLIFPLVSGDGVMSSRLICKSLLEGELWTELLEPICGRGL